MGMKNLRAVNRFFSQIKTTAKLPAPILATRRGIQVTTYDKNHDDEIHSRAVPDDVIDRPKSDKYWGPNPQTGVFGPLDTTAVVDNKHSSSNSGTGVSSTPDLAAWFRPLEDVDKPTEA